MKHIINVSVAFFSLLALAVSCVDDSIDGFAVEKPESIAGLEYLDAYQPLKTYVDYTASPFFKLGAGVTVSEYLEKGHVYRFINSNFDIMTAGNAMKYSSVVGDEGKMNFSQVTSFVEAAKGAGMKIYGHTLLWHAQQNNVYLNSIIADQEIVSNPDDANNSLHVTTPKANANVWDWQLNYLLPTPLTSGVAYTLKMRVKASTPFTMAFWRTNGSSTNYGPDMAVGESWSDVSVTFTPTFAATKLQFCFGTFGGDLFFDDLVLTESGSETNLVANGNFDDDVLTGWEKPSWHGYSFLVESVAAGPSKWWTNQVTNSNCESDDVSSFFATEVRVGPNAATFGPAGSGADGVGRCIIVKSGDAPINPWDTQFFVNVPRVFKEGDVYRFSMKVKANKAATIESQAHSKPGGYLHYAMVGSPAVTTEWKVYENSGIISASQAGMSTIAFNLAVLGQANTYYFDDIVWELEESGNKRPLTAEEKADTLSWAMDKWISGMMTATNGYVTEWDVVNEALAGSDQDGDGYYDLQSVKNVSADDAENNFYWQDYLGDDFVRVAVKSARTHGPADMKLFINDYNLESDWDDNKKLKSLIHWIERWESDGVTVVDGIGTQMHISYHLNPETQASKEAHVVKMFELMAATGKLVKVTELDMGLVDENGKTVMATAVTSEQYKAMSNYYKFIVQKYFEIIPAAQRYGITHWCPTDSPVSSSWRGGEPVGLWTEKTYRRKHTYAGFADGLEGK
ncbi:MAG: endo-1,4-beta-xylanase [Breznakibacter sp.]